MAILKKLQDLRNAVKKVIKYGILSFLTNKNETNYFAEKGSKFTIKNVFLKINRKKVVSPCSMFLCVEGYIYDIYFYPRDNF